MKRLQALVVRNNHLESLPAGLATMPNLRELYLEGNPELGIPESLLETNNAQEILRYYFGSRESAGRPLLEVKLLVVGRGKAGKTTVVKQLAGESPDERESETHSIAIRELTLECPKGKVRTRAWDFGGQEILHSTHQFVLTERSLYLLVLEPRTGRAIRRGVLVEADRDTGGESPVIVAMNYRHPRPWRVDEVKLRRKFPFIVAFVATDALHGKGIERLRETMLQTISEMRDVWLPFPERWRKIKDEVAGMKENFLTYARYTELVQRV